MDSLAAALGPLYSAKKKARRARQAVRMHHIQQASGNVQTISSPSEDCDSPTARYRRWTPSDAPEKPAYASSPSQRVSPVGDKPSSPEDGGDGTAGKSPAAAETEAETWPPGRLDTRPTQVLVPHLEPLEQPQVQAHLETPAAGPPADATERQLEPELCEQRSPAHAAPEPEPEPPLELRRAKQRASLSLEPEPEWQEPPAELDIRPWDRGFNLPIASQREKRSSKSPARPGTAPAMPSDASRPRAVQRQPSGQRQQQPSGQQQSPSQRRRPGPPGRQQQLPPVPTKRVAVSQHGKRLGIAKDVCEDCQLLRPVMVSRLPSLRNPPGACESRSSLSTGCL